MSQVVVYFLHSTSVLLFYIDVVLILSFVTLAIVVGKCDVFSHTPKGCCSETPRDMGKTTYTTTIEILKGPP